MGLRDLLGRARSFLGRPRVVPATDAVWHHIFDEEVYRKLLTEAPALGDLVEELQMDYDYADDMVRDVLMQFWQEDPRLRTQTEMDPRYLRNHAVATDVAALPETPELRAKTKHDRYAATMATLSVAEHVKDFLKRQDELSGAQEEAQDAQEAADSAAGEGEDALAAAEAGQEALDDALGEMGQPDMQGPLTEAQTQAQAAADATQLTLEQALALAEQQAQQAEEAGENAQAAARAAQQAMRAAIREAVVSVKDTLESEAELFAAWGIGPGEMQKMDFTERMDKAQRFKNHRLAKYRRMLGRYRYEAAAMQMRKVDYGRDEMVGVELSGDIGRMLESELAELVSDEEELSLLAMARVISHQALSRKYVGTEKVGQGAIICLVDNSYSMTDEIDSEGNTREAMAKAMQLALLDDARAGGRDFVGINFSSAGQISVWEFPKGLNDVGKAMAMTEEFFGGGTAYEQPLDAAIDILEEHFNERGQARADLVMITDDECFVTPAWMKTYQERKARLGFRLFGVQVGLEVNPDGVLASLADRTDAVMDFFGDPVPHLSNILKVA